MDAAPLRWETVVRPAGKKDCQVCISWGNMNSDIQNLLRYGNRKPFSTFWCKRCNVPLIQERCEGCGKQGIVVSKGSLRPVFKEELDIIRRQSRSRSKWLSLPDLSFWAAKRSYFYNGEKVFSCGGLTNGKPFEIKLNKGNDVLLPKKPLKPEAIIKRLKKANWSSLNRLEYQAIEFIEQATKTFYGRLPVVSFSGGKDSCVVSHLVRLALGTKTVHIFGDTTIEYPDTYKFIEDFKKNNPTVPFLTAKPAKTFFEFTDEIGPPSRILRWCCTTQKTGPISNLMASLNGNGVLTFDGIRKSESLRRSKYDVVSLKSKISSQVLIHPIFFWSDTDIWCYILSRDIDNNLAYKYGFTRVGCLYCPFNSGWSEHLAHTKYKKQTKRWQSFLDNFSETICHKDKIYFMEKGWKTQVAGRKLGNYESLIRNQCCEEDDVYTYELSSWKESFFEFFKPFGMLSRIRDDRNVASYNVVDPRTNSTMFFIGIARNTKKLRIVVFRQKNKKLLLTRIDGQIKRFQSCVLCGQCQSVCRSKASHQNTGEYYVDENKCNNCLECVKKTCIAIDALRGQG